VALSSGVELQISMTSHLILSEISNDGNSLNVQKKILCKHILKVSFFGFIFT